MQYPLLSEYLSAITNASDNLDKLKHLVVVPDQYGEPYRSSGAFAVVFKMQDPTTGKYYALKCFTEEQEGRAEAYRRISQELEYVRGSYFPTMSYYEDELFVDSSISDKSEFPVLLMDWIEGETMEVYISKHYQDSYRMGMLCHNFCRLASWLRSQPFAHGDIKPDNIIVDERGSLTLIDCDGMYVPSMQGESSPTMGTQDFRHPLRTPQHFDDTIDDFTLATIALSLRAITLEPTLLDRYGAADRLLFCASDYLDLSKSAVLAALLPLASDRDLAKLLSLFLLAHAEQSLSATAFHLFSAVRPEKPEPVEILSTEVTEEDLENAYTDSYGVKLSPDGKRLLEAPKYLSHYTVPDSVKVICDSAFSWRENLKSITLPTSLTSIGKNPFIGLRLKIHNASPHFCVEDDVLFTADKTMLIAYCSDKTTYQVPESVTSIGDSAFWACSSLRAITLPESLTRIGNWAFGWCSSLTNITLPESLTSIGESAFSDCYSLSSLTLPASLKRIEGNPFRGLRLKIHSASPHFCVEDDILFTADKTKLIAYCSDKTTYQVPESVTSIGDSAFYKYSSLTDITLPEGLTSIGDSAFSGCRSLTDITLPTSLKSIGDEAFSSCSRLSSLTLPTGLTNIVGNPFPGLKLKLQNKSPHFYVEDDLLFTADKTKLIAYCSDKTTYQVPESVTSIGDEAFSSCSRLTDITLPKSLTSIGDSAFSHCSRLTDITLPTSLTSIGASAFSNCSRLTDITLPKSLTSIGDSAFLYCSSLTDITLPEGLTSIGKSAFHRCSSLTDITLPESLTSIGYEAFSGCKSLTDITLPESLTSIGYEAFSGCKSLRAITLPKSLTRIEGNSFIGLRLKLHSASPHFWVEDNVLFTRDKTMLIAYCSDKTCYQVPESVTSIGDKAFSGCSSLTDITLPTNLTKIGDRAFYECRSLTDITLPKSLTSIGKEAFYRCSSLSSLTLPASLTSIGKEAFYRCSSLSSLTLPASLTSIGDRAFDDCSSLSSLTLLASLTSIGKLAFSGCSSLSSLTLPASLTSIGVEAFSECSRLSSLTLPASLTSIGECAFSGCSSLSSLTLPASLTSIGDSAFWGCSSLSSLTLPASLTSIWGNPFAGLKLKLHSASPHFYVEDDVLFTRDKTMLLAYCSAKTSYQVPESVTSIGEGAFAWCSRLTEITLPTSLTSIGERAFAWCSRLTDITLPKSLTSIWDRAFSECSSLDPSVREELRQRFGDRVLG